jgi:hypothetical protein
MNTARIVVLTIALSTGGLAACLASRPADIQPTRTESIMRLLTAAGTGDARFAIEPSTAAQR